MNEIHINTRMSNNSGLKNFEFMKTEIIYEFQPTDANFLVNECRTFPI